MQKWEYLTVQFSDANPTHENAVPLPVMAIINGKSALRSQPIHETVSKLGQDGWEMVGALSTEELFGHYLFFKRPATEEPQAQPEDS